MVIMLRNVLYAIVAPALILLFCAQTCTAQHINWRKVTEQDLAAAQKYLREDSIGGADRQNPEFSAWLNQGWQQALAKSRRVNSASSYNLVLNFYLNQFHDEHIEYVPYLARFDFNRLWPGFTIYFNDNHYWVSGIARLHNQSLPPAHAELISCNDRSIHNLLLQRVFPYFGNPKLNADWHIVTPRLFFYSPNPWFTPLRSCLFNIAGKKKIYRLQWRPVNAEHARDLRLQAGYGPSVKTGSHPFAKNALWINLPSFMPRTKTQIHALKRLVNAASTWRNKSIIVFDTRGNLGGLSLWGTQILQNLYGSVYYTQQTYALQNSQYQWRVSSGNLHQLNHFFLPMVEKDFGETSEQTKQLQHTINGINMALQAKQVLFPAEVTPPSPLMNEIILSNPVKAQIYWLTDGLCASSCLTFGDQLMRFPKVLQVGQPTHADTDYTELRLVRLPSGAHLYFPMKVQRFRARGNNQAYIPSANHYYHHNMSNSKALENWLLTLNKKDS